ncbi:hypothetical protein AGMMS49921_08510 [Endomicrobiia bacterium]|nr:hypothetical protein AGMMS49921_08510 [Endomicrobiia bacterium]
MVLACRSNLQGRGFLSETEGYKKEAYKDFVYLLFVKSPSDNLKIKVSVYDTNWNFVSSKH